MKDGKRYAVRVFSATKAREREALGERVTRWLRLRENRGIEVIDKAVQQSSDREFHCLSIVLVCRRSAARKRHK